MNPAKLQGVHRRQARDFRPDLFTKMLSRVKDCLMGNQKQNYTLEHDKTVIGVVDIHSYPRSQTQHIGLLLDPNFEGQRQRLMEYTLNLLPYWPGAKIYTTIYNDNPAKLATLKRVGFVLKEVYWRMLCKGAN